MALTLRGEAGKALDASVRTPALLKIRDMELRIENVAEDSLTWTARTQDLLGSMTILPDIEQTVSLYQGSTRIFHGHVSDPRDIDRGTRVTVLGPWWWLKRTQLTQAGTAGDRPTLELPEGTVKGMITTLLNRAIAKGVPIRIGTIADTLTITKQQFSEMTFADALADLLRFIADGVAWWDYSSGLPAFNLTRRAGALDTTYGIGPGAGQVIERDVQPVSEALVTRVELAYMVRSATGVPVQQQQASGTAAAGRTQVIAVSGPERDTFVPADDYDAYTVQTVAASASIGTLRPTILNMLPEVLASRTAYAGRPFATDVTLANGEVLTTTSTETGGSGSTTYFHPQPPLQYLDAVTGAAVSPVGKHLVLTPDPPEWLTLPGAQRVKLTGRIYVLWASTIKKPFYGPSDAADGTPAPTWAAAFPWTIKEAVTGWASTTSFAQPFPYDRFRNNIWALDFEIAALLTTTSYAGATVFAKPQAFEYLTPPAGMAAGLLAMQNFTPYKGRIVRKGTCCDGLPMMHRKFNLSGGRAVLATMGALPKAVTFEFRNKTVSIELGPPARHSVGTIAQRFKVSSQTNITITNS